VIALQLVPVVLSLLVLGAHFLRAGNLAMVGVVLVLLGLLGARRWWAARCVQAALLLGTVEWVLTLREIAAERASSGRPAVRLWIILGSVALVTAFSALMFQTARMKSRYGLGRDRSA